MQECIVVQPRNKAVDAFARLCHAVFRFFAYVGEGVMKFPNKVFYAVLVVLCALSQVFAVFIVVALLCGTDRRWSG